MAKTAETAFETRNLCIIYEMKDRKRREASEREEATLCASELVRPGSKEKKQDVC